MRGIYGFLVMAIFTLIAIYLYNRFLAKPGESIATLGKPPAA